MAFIVSYISTQPQSSITNKMLSDSRIYKNEYFKKRFKTIALNTHNEDEARVKSGLIEFILSNKKIYKNDELMRWLGYAVAYANTAPKAEIVKKIALNTQLHSNPDFIKNSSCIINSSYTSKQAEIKLSVIDTILKTRNLSNNPCFIKHCPNIIISATTDNQAKAKSEFMKIIGGKKLPDDESYIKLLSYIISSTNTKEEAETNSKNLEELVDYDSLFPFSEENEE